jgi:HD-GYP domain-containing protein (c-di-GMP phosphodiesterase class II)
MTDNDPQIISTQEIEQVADNLVKLAIISDFSKILAVNLGLPEIYNRLAQTVLKLFPDGDTLFISRFFPETQQITCVYARVENQVLDPAQVPANKLEPPGRGIQSETIHARQPMLVNDLLKRLRKTQGLSPASDEGEAAPMQRSVLCVPMMSQNKILGVVQVQVNTLNRFNRSDIEYLAMAANTTAMALNAAQMEDNNRLYEKQMEDLRRAQDKHIEDLQKSNEELLSTYDETLAGLVQALDLRNHETEGHTRRVAEMTAQLAKVMGQNEDQIRHIKRGALLHDIGKLGIPDHILFKTESLDKSEWEIMRRHPQYAYEMVQPISYLRPALDIPYYHHEWWDGSGYPKGLKGEAIPIGARIFAVVDVWDSLTSSRSYRKAWQKDEALEYINTLSGSQFDPQVIKAFSEIQQANTTWKFPGKKPG